MEEIKRMNTHLGMAFPENYVDSYFTVKSMENYEEEIPKIKNIVLFLLPGYKPGNDPSTRVDSAFMFTAFSIKKLGELGFTPVIFTDDGPYNPGFDEKKHASSVFDTKDIGIFESIGHCFEPDSPVALILCSCSAASPYTKPKNFLTFASEELPENVLLQGPELPTSIYDVQRAGELPLFIFDGWTSTRGKRAALSSF